MSLAILDLQVTLIFPTKLSVDWPFVSGYNGQNRFSRWPLWRLAWISDRTILAIFDLQVALIFLLSFQQ